MIELRLYTRRACHLCDAMKAVIDAETRGFPVRLTVVDVDSESRLAAEHGEDVPVLFVGGKKFAKHRLERGRLREKLRRAGEPGEAREASS